MVPERGGVYRLTSRDLVIYVGKAVDLRERLGDHLKGQDSNACVQRHVRAGGVYFQHVLVSREADRVRLEQQLIKQHRPKCNAQ